MDDDKKKQIVSRAKLVLFIAMPLIVFCIFSFVMGGFEWATEKTESAFNARVVSVFCLLIADVLTAVFPPE